MQNGELKSLKPHQVESSTVVQSSQPAKLKRGIIVHGLYTYQGLYFCVSSFSWDVEPEKNWKLSSCFLVEEREKGREREWTQTPSLFKSYDQFYTVLFLTVKPGSAMSSFDYCREQKATVFKNHKKIIILHFI